MARARLGSCLAALSLAACATAHNYPDASGPRFAGSFAGQPRAAAIRVVSFNVKYGRNLTGAAALLRGDVRLKGADVIALQEMDERGVECLARSLGLNYVYYPAAAVFGGHRNFGNAILSPWPIEDDRKLVLPHPGRWRHMQRIAVAATVRVRDQVPIRVLSLHLETPISLGPGGKRDQARAVLESTAGYPRVVVAGDFNGHSVAEVFVEGGLVWLTRDIGHTISRFSWDHLLARGLRLLDCTSVGAAPNAYKVSDHVPVWADLVPE
jgi:endonuclease/exonuclease/phosphatase family metal-dependent hydrolase